MSDPKGDLLGQRQELGGQPTCRSSCRRFARLARHSLLLSTTLAVTTPKASQGSSTRYRRCYGWLRNIQEQVTHNPHFEEHSSTGPPFAFPQGFHHVPIFIWKQGAFQPATSAFKLQMREGTSRSNCMRVVPTAVPHEDKS